MANEVLVKVGTQIIFADHATDFSGGTSGTSLEVATATDVQFDTTDVADTAARQSTQTDLGATRARSYCISAAVEMAATPTTGEPLHFYWVASNQSTAGDGNPGYASGADGAYAGGVAELAEGLAQLIYIGSMILSADATTTVQVAVVSPSFSPPQRYGSLVIWNESGAAFHSDAAETHVVMDPIVDEVQ